MIILTDVRNIWWYNINRCEAHLVILIGNINRWEIYLVILTGNINQCQAYLVILTLSLPTVTTNALDLCNETSPTLGESPKHNARQNAITTVKPKDSNVLKFQPSLYVDKMITILCTTIQNLTQLNAYITTVRSFLARQPPSGPWPPHSRGF